jgi:GTPase SAR1 family protein
MLLRSKVMFVGQGAAGKTSLKAAMFEVVILVP